MPNSVIQIHICLGNNFTSDNNHTVHSPVNIKYLCKTNNKSTLLISSNFKVPILIVYQLFTI